MDPVTMITTALALGAAAGLQAVAQVAVGDAYAALKTFIQQKYAKVNLALLEGDPGSDARKKVVEEDLRKAKADEDQELLQHAKALLDAVHDQAPDAAQVVGVSLKDIQSASIAISNIVAKGKTVTGVQMENIVSKDIKIEDVRATGKDDEPPPNR